MASHGWRVIWAIYMMCMAAFMFGFFIKLGEIVGLLLGCWATASAASSWADYWKYKDYIRGGDAS